MATLLGNLTEIRGKMGKEITVYQRLGMTVCRTLPEGFQPCGEKQLAQQRRIKGCNTFYKAVRAVGLGTCWNLAEKRPGWTGFNLFMHHNLPAFSTRGWIEAPEKVRLTQGRRLQLPDDLRMARAEGDARRWVVTWREATRYPVECPDDRPVVALMRGGKYFDVKFAPIAGDARRGDGRAEFVVPENLKDYVHCYLFFASEDGRGVSTSEYLGVLL